MTRIISNRRGRPLEEGRTPFWESSGIRLFIESLEKSPSTQVLDIGPVCSENINFFGKHVKRLFVCDLFIRATHATRNDKTQEGVLEELRYPHNSFDGILLWGIMDRFPDRESRMLLETCRLMAKPGGLVLLMSFEKSMESRDVSSIVLGNNYRCHLRMQPHLDLPHHHRQNRELITLLKPLTLVKSFIYPGGIREFLLNNK